MKHVLLFLFLFETVSAQNLNPLNFTNIIPPSPEVSALGKYVNTPISYSTGLPEISIPLYTVQTGNLSVPISLSYHASGLRVEEAATWVGLGWSLSFGGSVSRVVRGLPDDIGNGGFMYTAYNVDTMLNNFQTNSSIGVEMYSACSNSTLDFEPDQFMFSILGYSGQFYYDQRLKQFVQTPHSRIKISYTTIGSSEIGRFVLTLPDGTICHFGTSGDGTRQAYDSLKSQTSETYSSHGGYGLSTSNQPSNITTWQLMDIISPTGKTINFYYTSYTSIDYGRAGESIDYPGSSGCTAATQILNASFYQQLSTKSRLSEITTDNCSVWFVPSSQPRTDVLSTEYGLDSVVVRNNSDSLIRAYVFYESYLKSTDSSGFSIENFYGSSKQVTDVSNKRLRLDSLKEFGSGGTAVPPYVFTYNTTYTLPDRLSTNQDFWGYYNHAGNSTFLTPTVLASVVNPGTSGYITGATRTVDTNYAQASMLTQVTYPTGGNTQYFYESNKANLSGAGAVMLSGYSYSELVNKSLLFYNATWQIDSQTAAKIVYVDTFSVGPVPSGSQASITATGCSNYNSISCPLTIVITGITNPSFSLGINSPSFDWSLPQGEYQIKCTAQINDDTVASFNVSINWQEYAPGYNTNNSIVGGLRLKQLISYDPIGNTTLVRTLKYQAISDPTGATSSGVLTNVPVHTYLIPCGYGGGGGIADLTQGGMTLPNVVVRIASNSALPLSSSDGIIVRYTYVTEFQDSNATAMKADMSFFDDQWTTGYNCSYNFPFPSNVQRDWRDLMLEKKQYVYLGDNNYNLVNHEINYYTTYQPWTNDTIGFKIAPLPSSGSPAFQWQAYGYNTEWYVLDSTMAISYPSNSAAGDSLVVSTKYLYDTTASDYVLMDQRTLDSRGLVLEKKTSYPQDYNSSAGDNMTTLVSNNMVEKAVKQENDRNGEIISGSLITYYPTGLPQNVYSYENPSPEDTVSINPSLILPSYFTLKDLVSYNASGNISQVTSQHGYIRAYLWDYLNEYPICQVLNADTSDIAYTSFEADGSGNWTIPGTSRSDTALTGRLSYDLTGSNSITKSYLNTANTYVVGYWGYSGNSITINGSAGSTKITLGNWTYYEAQVSGVATVTVGGTGRIDELRLYPKGALMSTYTFAPLIGITSQSDPSGKITYYTYDGLGRLHMIQDQYGNILKRYDYEYQTSNQ
jgi:YD repeat-containing protein